MDHIPEEVPELKDLDELQITKWHTLGIKLGFAKAKLEEIQANNVHSLILINAVLPACLIGGLKMMKAQHIGDL